MFACLARATGAQPQIDQDCEQTAPLFKGTPDEFVAQHNNPPELKRQMKNKACSPAA